MEEEEQKQRRDRDYQLHVLIGRATEPHYARRDVMVERLMDSHEQQRAEIYALNALFEKYCTDQV